MFHSYPHLLRAFFVRFFCCHFVLYIEMLWDDFKTTVDGSVTSSMMMNPPSSQRMHPDFLVDRNLLECVIVDYVICPYSTWCSVHDFTAFSFFHKHYVQSFGVAFLSSGRSTNHTLQNLQMSRCYIFLAIAPLVRPSKGFPSSGSTCLPDYGFMASSY